MSDVWGSREFRLSIASQDSAPPGASPSKPSHLSMTNTVLGLSSSGVVLEGRKRRMLHSGWCWLQKCLLHVLILLQGPPFSSLTNLAWSVLRF